MYNKTDYSGGLIRKRVGHIQAILSALQLSLPYFLGL